MDLPAGLRRTLTWGPGNEMFHREQIESATGLRIYFAEPRSPWRRGSNENTNGLPRQYFPSGTNLSVRTSEQLGQVAAELDDRPRECLNDSSPNQMMRRWYREQTSTIRDVRQNLPNIERPVLRLG